jgi:hypothetical protein
LWYDINSVSEIFNCLSCLSAFPCVFAVLPDRKKSTYQQLFQELNAVAVSMGQIWKPEQIMSDFEASLIPAVSAEVKTINHFIRHICCSF